MKRRPRAIFFAELARRGRLRFVPRSRSTAAIATEIDIRMMRRSLELADVAASRGEVPIGAVVYISPGRPGEGTILAEAFNERESLADPSAHAEFTAMTRAARQRGDWRLSDCTVAVTLEPCPMCAGMIINARVGRVVYGADDPKAGAVRTLYTMLHDRRLNHRPIVIHGVSSKECGDRLAAFFRGLREQRRGKERA
ncbi:MAG TPA: nucleoside deaminase [Phycisphaerales bacterium]|nr:nucleoside deaminase [Phycisphaerales bacterium]